MQQKIARIWANQADKAVLLAGLAAATRLGINILVSMVDMLPWGIGEAVSWTADVWKLIARRLTPIIGVRLDLTPAVSFRMAAGTEFLEIFGMGSLPTHAIETIRQLQLEDWQKLKALYELLRRY